MELVPLQTDLGPKDVARLLGLGERTARRLMESGQIESMRAGKPWRTSLAHVAAYQRQQFALAQESVQVRKLLQSIVCLREVERLGVITAEQSEMLEDFEEQLVDHRASKLPRVA